MSRSDDDHGASPRTTGRRAGERLELAIALCIFAGLTSLAVAAPDAIRPASPVEGGTADVGAVDRPAADSGAKAHTIREAVTGMGAATVEVPVFDCRGVREDEVAEADQFPVPPPPFSEDVFPCTRCHDRPDDFNLDRRTLTVEHKYVELVHGPREQWCYGCHNPTDRDKLRLAGGRTIEFSQSYELCGQCHGPKLRDWRMGVHGRRTGCWNGRREYRLCVHCHNPHAPHFAPLEPEPMPLRPSEIR